MSQAELLVARLERMLKILIPLGDIDRTDKLLNLLLVGRLAGHQNFSHNPAICLIWRDDERKAATKAPPS